MKVAYATYLVTIMWLLLATPYCIYSHSIDSHITWECLANSCFKNTHNNVIFNPKVWYNNFNVYSCSTNYHTPLAIKWWRDSGHKVIHTINDCSFRSNNSVVVTVDACVFSYVCFKCLGDVWNVEVLTKHNMHKATYNQFVIVNMNNCMYTKWHYHRMYVNCMHTRTHMLFRLEHVNRFFFPSQFLGGLQLNLWKGIRGKITRSISHSKLNYKPSVCFVVSE